MKETVAFLKRACGGVYHFAGGQMYCRNASMMAGAPSPIQSLIAYDDFNVPQGELADVLRRFDEPEVSFDGRALVVHAARGRRAKVDTTTDTPPPVMTPPTVWSPVPDGLLLAVEMARCFTEDGAMRWTACIRLTDGRVTAIRPTGGIDVTVPGLVGRSVLITSDIAAFLVDTVPEEIAIADTALWARWGDGRWLRAQLFAGEMPAVDAVFDNAMGPAEVSIDDEWRDAFADAAALTDSAVRLSAAGFGFARGAGNGEATFATGLPEDHYSVWWVKALEPVMKYAQRWNPAGYPKPVRFEGENFRGVVIGRE